MRTMGSIHPHADDGALVQLLDAELDEGVARGLRAHLSECADCAARLDDLRTTSRRLDRLLTESARSLDTPTAHAGPGRATGRRQIAAALAALLAAGALAPPVRAWVAGRVDTLIERLGPAPDVRGEAGPDDAAVIRVVPVGSLFVVEVVGVDPSGVLEVRRGDGASVVLELETPGPGVVVGSGRVRLEGGPAGAVYRLAVPPGVERVVLRDAAMGRTDEVPVPAGGVTRVPIRP